MENCETRGKIYHHPLYIFPVANGMISAWLTFPIVYKILKNYAFQVYYHPNVRILLGVTLFSCIILACATVYSSGIFMLNMFVKSNTCQMFLETRDCSFVRSSFLFAFCVLTTSHFSLLVERMIATYRLSQYEKQGHLLGIFLSVLSILISGYIIHIVLQPEDPSELITSCMTFSASKSVGANIYRMLTFQFFVDLALFLIHAYLWKLNISNRKYSTTLNLSGKFQQGQNIKILRQTSSLILTSSATIGIYIFIISIFRMFKDYLPDNWYELIAANLFIMPYLPFILTLTMYFSLRRDLKERSAHHQNSLFTQNNFNKNYFKTTSDSWDMEYHEMRKRGSSLPVLTI